MDYSELWAHMSAQSAELAARWEEAMQMQIEQQNTLMTKQEVARDVQTVYTEVGKTTSDHLMFQQMWAKSVDKTAENNHAAALGLDAPHRNTDMPTILFDPTNEDKDWGWLHTENPFNKTPQEAAEEAQALGEGAGV